MKKHLSVLMLVARSTIYKIIGVLIIIAGVEFVLFVHQVGKSEGEAAISLE